MKMLDLVNPESYKASQSFAFRTSEASMPADITMQDIAERAGVSVTTVSHV